MASAILPRYPARVTSAVTGLLDLAGQVNGYWSRHEFSKTYRECWSQLTGEERMALGLVEKALFRLFPFDPDLDLPERMAPQHAI